MSLLQKIKDYANKNVDKKIAMFVDMDGVIVNLDIDTNNEIASNKANLFFNKKPLKTVIAMLNEVSKIENIDLYILSACAYKEQADDKEKWLELHAPIFKKENQIFVVREIVNYTKDSKAIIKTNNILDILQKNNYDLAIYFEDEYLMLRAAYKLLKEKIWCIHISNFIE